MWWHVIFFSAFCVFLAASRPEVGPAFPPTSGELWPKARQQVKEDTYFKYTPSTFAIAETGETCAILKTAIERYTNVLRSTYLIAQRYARKLSKHLNVTDAADTATESNNRGTLQALLIHLSAPCETYPHLDMDEKYTLNISSFSTLNSDSIWGVLRGLETFSQLFYMSNGYKDVLINTTQIVDFPKYTHRGLLIDTSRHYLSMATILKTLDAMEMNKMNVLHWLIVDDESFPYQSEILPKLSNGAYDPTMVYTAANINQIINYARDRGIRVLPEFGVPGHAGSWGVAYPDILTKCYTPRGTLYTDFGPMDPTNNATYKIISDLFHEVQERFPDKYLHIGGIDMDSSCWYSNRQINKFREEHNMTTSSRELLLALFMTRVIPLLGDRSKPIVWEEIFNEEVPLPAGTIIQVWKSGYGEKLYNILKAGHKVIYSASWQLHNIKNNKDWQSYYKDDPREMLNWMLHLLPPADLHTDDILGGEAVMWGHYVDDTNIMSRVWPRASAVAELLWSDASLYSHWPENRLEEHVCRMNRRGIDAQPPNGPGFCITGN